ncbi:Transcription initiation factor tfiid subunit 4b [Thalictrum thalictroides]|uniref:Transcription initiation factor tfiid subunit 4b n=1 Tax=Thalictrum thalictroides TaxID=46969 RepID=A0A7J6WCB2_THATH|nr:Transcription initiation factor tfiid subunit 4b [Thalictrum thalictroides]
MAIEPNIVKLLEGYEDDVTIHSGGADVEASATLMQQYPTQAAQRVSIGKLLSVIVPHIDKDKAMQLQTLLSKLKKQEIQEDGFLRHLKSIVGDQMLIQAVQMQCQVKIQTSSNSQKSSHQLQLQPVSQNSSQQQHGSPATGNKHNHNLSRKSGLEIFEQNSTGEEYRMRKPDQHQYSTRAADSENHNKQVSIGTLLSVIVPHIDKDKVMQLQTLYSKLKKREIHKNGFLTHLRSIVGDQMLIQAVQMQGQAKAKAQAQAASNSQKSSQNSSQQQQSQEQQISQIPASLISTFFGSAKNNQGNPAPTGTNSISNSMPTQLDSSVAVRTQVIPSTSASLGLGTSIKTAPEKPTIGQKKPLDDAVGSPSSLASKKQKVSGAFLDQSIEQLNDVTTVSGVDLREEEEQLFYGRKEDSRASEPTRRVVQEKEEMLILQKIPLQNKLSKIMSKCGIKNMSKDVERCLSLCLEERMRGLIKNLIRVSKQRVDVERSIHRTNTTSDVRRQILVMNMKAKEDWEKKQAEKLQKTTEAEGKPGADSEKGKDEGRSKNHKENKEEDDKMRTTAANAATRVAVGGDDMYSKWLLMAKQAQQKRQGMDSASFAQMSKDITRETHDGENRSSSATASRGMRKPVVMPHTKVVRTISVKDVLAVLEREPQMLKSALVYRLYVGLVYRLYVMSAYGQTAE